jgi:Polysaccharide deacetylase
VAAFACLDGDRRGVHAGAVCGEWEAGMTQAAWRKPRDYFVRSKLASSLAALIVLAVMPAWAVWPAPAAAAVPTVVTIEWHDGNADQINVLPILDDPARPMHATFLVNTGPILAQDPAKLTAAQVQAIFNDGNEIGGHTLDHVNVQPLPTADARNQICTDRNNLLDMGVAPTTFAYPFASFDAGSEDVAHYCNYNDASATAGLTLKGPVANTIPPADPYAIRTVPAVKKSTKLTTLEQYVFNAEASAQARGSAWVIFVFHHLCGVHAHCGPYVISPAKFGAFLDFLHQQAANGVVVKTMAGVMAGTVKGTCDPVSGTGCDTTPR